LDRRTFIAAVAVGLFAASRISAAQTSGRVYSLGILHSTTLVTDDPVALGNWMSTPLRELGYVEGQNLIIERKYAEEKFDRLPGLARELVQLRVDVIFAVGVAPAKAAVDATTTIPIVWLGNLDPVAGGLVTSLARPGGNVTGVLISPEGTLAVKKLEVLKEAVSGATRIALLVPDDSGIGMRQQLQEVRKAASSLGVDLTVVDVRGGDYDRAFITIAAARPQALLVGAHSFFVRDRKKVIELAAKYRLPAIYEWPLQVRDGGLMSYGASDTETYRQVATYIDRIFQGAKPGDLPIWQPSKLHFVINVKTAKALGLAIPPLLLLRADELIQ
jgi:putative ABC transport system substrate-binding protein